LDISKVYPYVVPEGYLENPAAHGEGMVLPLGHDVNVMLVHDLGGMCRNVFAEEAAAWRVTLSQLHRRAQENLADFATTGALRKSLMYVSSPRKIPFVLWHAHWLAASCIRLPDLHSWASENLGAQEICISIPQREAMLMFPKGDRSFRDQMREMIFETEKDSPKCITFELFSLSPAGISPFTEDDSDGDTPAAWDVSRSKKPWWKLW